MGCVVQKMVSVVVMVILLAQLGQAEVNKYGTALAADIWNSLSTRDELETFLSTGKNKAERAEIKKILSGLKTKGLATFVNRDTVLFGQSQTKWSLDAAGGVWINGKLFEAKDGSTLSETVKQYQVWKKQNQKTSMMNLWVQPAYAQATTGLDPADDAVYFAFMAELGQLVNKPCLFQMGQDALKKLEEKSPTPAGAAKPKINTMAIICSDQNPNGETIFGASSGNNVAIMMNGEYAKSPSTSKTYLKRVRVSLAGENRVNVNFIESATGADVHTMDVKFEDGGKFQVLDRNQIQAKSASSCTAELAQRMITAIYNVCENRKASGYVQKSFGQTSGQPPAKAAAGAQGERAK